MKIEHLIRKPFRADAVRVTKENLMQVASWCGGEIGKFNNDEKFVKVNVRNALREDYTRAKVGDWIIRTTKTGRPDSFKVYKHHVVLRNFMEVDPEKELFVLKMGD